MGIIFFVLDLTAINISVGIVRIEFYGFIEVNNSAIVIFLNVFAVSSGRVISG